MFSSFMDIAIAEARLAMMHDDVPVGAVLVKNDRIIAQDHNRKEITKNACAHAEMLVLQSAFQHEDDWRLNDYTLISTLEPCVMCAGAILHARISKVVFSAWDFKWGGFGSQCNLNKGQFNHRLTVCYQENLVYQRLLKEFFRSKRAS